MGDNGKRKKKKKKSSTTSQGCKHKESVLILKRNFHHLLERRKRKKSQDKDEARTVKDKLRRKVHRQYLLNFWDDIYDETGVPPPQQFSTASSTTRLSSGEVSANPMSRLLLDKDRSIWYLITWLTSSAADCIDWDGDTFHLILGGVHKNNSNPVDIITLPIISSTLLVRKCS